MSLQIVTQFDPIASEATTMAHAWVLRFLSTSDRIVTQAQQESVITDAKRQWVLMCETRSGAVYTVIVRLQQDDTLQVRGSISLPK